MSNHEVLRQCDVFSSLTSGEIDKIANLSSEKEYEAGMVLFQEKDQAEQLFVLKDGRVALQVISAVSPGRAVTVDVALKGDIVGWAPLLEPHVHDMRAVCLQKSRMLIIDASQLRQLLKENNQAYTTVMKNVVHAVIMRLNDTRLLLISERFWSPKFE